MRERKRDYFKLRDCLLNTHYNTCTISYIHAYFQFINFILHILRSPTNLTLRNFHSFHNCIHTHTQYSKYTTLQSIHYICVWRCVCECSVLYLICLCECMHGCGKRIVRILIIFFSIQHSPWSFTGTVQISQRERERAKKTVYTTQWAINVTLTRS